MKPIIGITMSVGVGKADPKELFVSREHSDAVMQAGGLPYFLPYTVDEKWIEQYVNQLDGLLLTGGWDVDPAYYGEDPAKGLGSVAPSRDETEIALTQAFLKTGKPILGICRGQQLLAIVLGCTLYQDLNTQNPEAFDHYPKIPRDRPMHTIQIVENSLLHQIIKDTSIKVNSMHHQSVRDLGDDVFVTATAADGVIEAIESSCYPDVLGVQYHPECMADNHLQAQALFDWLVERSKEVKKAQNS